MEQFDFWEGLDKPRWMEDTDPSYLTAMGSRAYGSATEKSDWDFYGFIIPPEELAFPFLGGAIPHFSLDAENFQQFQPKHGIPSEKFGKVDLFVYSLPRYFRLLANGNPNMVDSIFAPDSSTMVLDTVGEMVKDNRHLFLSQRIVKPFKGIAHSHMNKVVNRTRTGSRKAIVEKYGYDVKDASHVIRCLLEAKDFLFKGDCDLEKNGKLILKIKNGEWELEKVREFFKDNLDEIDKRMKDGQCVLPELPDEKKLERLLVDCLEERYGSLTALGWNTYGKDGQRC